MDGSPPSPAWSSPLGLASAAREPLLHGALELLEHVEQVPPHASGELVLALDGHTRGVVYVEHGRVCFVAARGLGARLSDRLRACARIPISEHAMEALVREGNGRRTPLGELLVDSGLMTPEALMGALRRHTADSLVHIGAGPVTSRWRPRVAGSYQPRFTLSPVMLAPCVGALLAGRDPAAPLDPFADFFGPMAAAAFARPDGVTVPVAAVGIDSVAEVRRLGAGVVSALDVAGLLDGGPRFVFTGDQGGRGILAWRDGDLRVGALVDDREGLARCLGPLLAR